VHEEITMKSKMELLASVALLVLAAAVVADEEKVPLDKAPKAVLDAVKAKYAGAKLLGAEKEKEDGKTVYEIQIKYKDHTIDVIVTPEGKIMLAEKLITEQEVPEIVARAFKKKYAKATVKKIEEISKDDKVTAYEYLIEIDKKKMEVKFDPAGKFLEEETKKEDKKDKKKEVKE
jgi:hypothetical protein